MAIQIKKFRENLLTAKVTPPHRKVTWETSEPLEKKYLIRQLLSLGCHQTDIGDALYDLDPMLVTIDQETREQIENLDYNELEKLADENNKRKK